MCINLPRGQGSPVSRPRPPPYPHTIKGISLEHALARSLVLSLSLSLSIVTNYLTKLVLNPGPWISRRMLSGHRAVQLDNASARQQPGVHRSPSKVFVLLSMYREPGPDPAGLPAERPSSSHGRRAVGSTVAAKTHPRPDSFDLTTRPCLDKRVFADARGEGTSCLTPLGRHSSDKCPRTRRHTQTAGREPGTHGEGGAAPSPAQRCQSPPKLGDTENSPPQPP